MIHESQNHLVKHLINRMRDVKTDSYLFRLTIEEISRLLLAEALHNRALQRKTIDTWIGPLDVETFDTDKLVFVPILRAGEPMLTGILKTLPGARSGFLAMKRNEETAVAHLYYDSLPELCGRTVILLDPMVATAGSLLDAITHIRQFQPQEIISINIIGAQFGIDLLTEKAPDVAVTIAQIDPDLDANQYIRPGLGDAGDRAFHSAD